jgi:hypothetical protein
MGYDCRMRVIGIVFELLLIVGGILGASALIVAQKPNAKAIIDKLVPFQALIGGLLLILGVVFFIASGPVAMFKAISHTPLPAAAALGGVLVAIILGFVFALPQIISITGQEQRAREIAEKIFPFQILLGLAAAACGVVGLLYSLGIMSIADKVGLAP